MYAHNHYQLLEAPLPLSTSFSLPPSLLHTNTLPHVRLELVAVAMHVVKEDQLLGLKFYGRIDLHLPSLYEGHDQGVTLPCLGIAQL